MTGFPIVLVFVALCVVVLAAALSAAADAGGRLRVARMQLNSDIRHLASKDPS